MITENIENLVAEIVAHMHQGQSFKVKPALKALPEDDLINLATEGLSYFVNLRMRQMDDLEDAA